jgi:acetoacetyl-CoA synthetase
VADLPRTINGKLSELAVRAAVHGRAIGNRDALANPQALELFRDLPELAV